MMKNGNVRSRRKLNAVDYFLIIAAVLCLAAAGLRMAFGKSGGKLGSTVVMEDYVVSFKISNIRNSSTQYLTADKVFYLADTKQLFGSIAGNVSVTPALYYLENADGQYVQAYAPENGDGTRVDVTGTMLVSGCMSDNGFLLGGLTALANNKSLALRSTELYVTITITDIAKAS